MAPIALAGLSILQFALLARIVFFDSWEEFKLAFAVLCVPLRRCPTGQMEARAKFAFVKLALLIFFSAILATLTWVAHGHLAG